MYLKYHYRLAKTYEEKGEIQRAIERYQHFLNLYKIATNLQFVEIDTTDQLACIKIDIISPWLLALINQC